MKICQHCHHENPDTAYYCFTCGQVLESTPEPVAPRPQEFVHRSPLPEQRQQMQDEETVPLSQVFAERPTEPNPLSQAYAERPTEPVRPQEPDTGPFPQFPPQRPVQQPLQKPSGDGVFDWVSSVLIAAWLVIQVLSMVLTQWVLPALFDLSYNRSNTCFALHTLVFIVSNLSYILPAIAVKKLVLRIICIVLAVFLSGYCVYMNVMNYLNAPTW